MKSSVLLCFLILFGLGNNLFGIFQTEPMYNYPLFLGTWTLFIYLFFCSIYVYPMMYLGHMSNDSYTVPKKKFLIMGLLDAISLILMGFATNYIVKKSLVPILQQSTIPFSMMFSRILTNTQFKKHNYVGASVIVLGLLTVLLPEVLTEKTESSNSFKIIIWSIVLIVSRIPSVLSSVYKEVALQSSSVDPMYLNMWIANFQIIISLFLLIPSSYITGSMPSKIPLVLKQGFLCSFGINSIKDISHDSLEIYDESFFNSNGTDLTPPHIDSCSMSPLYINMFIFFNFIFNIFLAKTLKKEGSGVFWIALTIIVPLSQIILWIPGVPGHVRASVFDILGFFLVLFGLFTYKYSVDYKYIFNRIIQRIRGFDENHQDVQTLTSPLLV